MMLVHDQPAPSKYTPSGVTGALLTDLALLRLMSRREPSPAAAHEEGSLSSKCSDLHPR